LPALHRSGREFPVEVRISPIDLDGGAGFVGCLRDLSARHALQQELHEAERQFRMLVESITDYAIYMLDPEGRVTTWNAGAERIGFAKITRDITAQRESQELLERAGEQLLQAGKMEAIGQLTGGVAHDFNNLLTIIIGNLAIAEREVEGLPEGPANRLRRSLASAERGAHRATTLTQRLLAFSRRQLLDPRPLDLNKLIAAEADFLQRTLGEQIEVEAVG